MNVLLLFLAKYLIGVVVVALAVYWLTLPRKEKLHMAVFGIITAIVAYALAKAGSALYYDPRPFVTHAVTPLYPHGPDNGFPSDHTLLAGVVAVTGFMASKKLGIALFVCAVLIGAARVIGHIHSPIDILGSLVFSILGGLVAYYATPRLLALFKKHEA